MKRNYMELIEIMQLKIWLKYRDYLWYLDNDMKVSFEKYEILFLID